MNAGQYKIYVGVDPRVKHKTIYFMVVKVVKGVYRFLFNIYFKIFKIFSNLEFYFN